MQPGANRPGLTGPVGLNPTPSATTGRSQQMGAACCCVAGLTVTPAGRILAGPATNRRT